MSLVQYFKKNPVLETDVGQFIFEEQIGQGGNAFVIKFSKEFESNKQFFAIKFMPHNNDKKKLGRFRDEFFCIAQIPSHKNISKSYHFDERLLNETTYSFIIMKLYQKTLRNINTIKEESEKIKEIKSNKLFNDLLDGLTHLHNNKIIHRDIKPENIFYDEVDKLFVIGDFGIAHFDSEEFGKEAETKTKERLGNYKFSAPEQSNGDNSKVSYTADIFSLGQVMQWFIAGETHHGTDRNQLYKNNDNKELEILDSIVEKCLKNQQEQRFQSTEGIYIYLQNRRKPERDSYQKLYDFDDAIRQSLTTIDKIEEVRDQNIIKRFIDNFQTQCQKDEFWYVLANGGDNTFCGLSHIDNSDWLFHFAGSSVEINIDKLIVYRNERRLYKSFFIILTKQGCHFTYVNSKGEIIKRNNIPKKEDMAILYKDKYIDPNETKNGYYDCNGQVISVNRNDFQERYRYLTPYAFLIVPHGSAASCGNYQHSINLLSKVIEEGILSDGTLKEYLISTGNEHSKDFTRWD